MHLTLEKGTEVETHTTIDLMPSNCHRLDQLNQEISVRMKFDHANYITRQQIMKYDPIIIALIIAIMIQSLPAEEPSKDTEDMKISKTAGPEYYSNVALSLAVGAGLSLKDPTHRQFSVAHGVSETHSISNSTYFYEWIGEPFSEKSMEALVDKLKPSIKRLEDKYGFKHYGSSFMFEKYAENYKPDHMSKVCLSFSDPKNDKLTYSCIILVFHTAPTVLAINTTSVLPSLK